jgi:LacI family transcriptional regulator
MAKKRRVAVMIEMEYSYRSTVDVYAGCQRYAAEAGWECVIHPFAHRALEKGGAHGRFEGILAQATPELMKVARKFGVPVVNVWMNSPLKKVPSVFPDCALAGEMAAEHLLGRGFRQFGFLGFSRNIFSRLQCDGFRAALKQEGFPCSGHRFGVAHANSMPASWGAFGVGLESWVDSWSLPIGIYVTEDLPCRYLIEACRAKGLRIPEDVAIVGSHDDVVFCSAPPTLTSINHGYLQVGYEAAALLDDLMEGGEPPAEPLLVAPSELIPRQTTDSFAVDDPLVRRALRFIAEHSHGRMLVSDVVVAVATTRRLLERRFRGFLQRTIAEEIARMRLERAKRRLIETEEPVNLVAVESGFSDADHLYKVFTRVEGVSPTAYREANQIASR